jgi:hypothetical protein
MLVVVIFDMKHIPFLQILYERRALSEKTLQVLNSSLASVIKESLAPETEFWNSSKTLTTLAEGSYFSSQSSGVNWPEGLKQFLNEGRFLYHECFGTDSWTLRVDVNVLD